MLEPRVCWDSAFPTFLSWCTKNKIEGAVAVWSSLEESRVPSPALEGWGKDSVSSIEGNLGTEEESHRFKEKVNSCSVFWSSDLNTFSFQADVH